MNRFLLTPLLLPLLLAAPASANPHSVVLAGTVTNPDGSPAIGAEVFAGGREQVTDAHGGYRWDTTAPGNTFISALAHDGSTYGSGSLTSMNIRLAPQPLQPPDVAMSEVVTAELTREIATLHLNSNKHPNGNSHGMPWLTMYRRDPNVFAAMSLIGDPKSDPNALLSAVAQIHDPQTKVSVSCAVVESRSDWGRSPGAEEFVTQLSDDIPLAEKQYRQKFPSAGSHIAYYAYALAAAFEDAGEPLKADTQLQAAQAAAKAFIPVGSDTSDPEVGGLTLLTHVPRLFDIVEKTVPLASNLEDIDLWRMCTAEVDRHDLSAALPYFNELRSGPETLKAGETGPTIGGAGHIPHSRPFDKGYYRQALESAIVKGGQAEPALALRLAQRASRESQKESRRFAIVILLDAALGQPQAQRRTLWSAGINRLTATDQVKFALAMRAVDPELANESYGIALAHLAREVEAAKNVAHGTDGRQAKFAAYELYFAPARARYRAERAFYAMQGWEENRVFLANPVTVVSYLDHQRAWEMAHQLPNTEKSGFAQQLSLFFLTMALRSPLPSDNLERVVLQ